MSLSTRTYFMVAVYLDCLLVSSLSMAIGNVSLNVCEPECPWLYGTKVYESCRCDSLCTVYGDCCASVNCSTNISTDVAYRSSFVCQDSTYISDVKSPPIIYNALSKFFWNSITHTTCPDEWILGGEAFAQELRVAIENQCVNKTQALPPVSDLSTGFDYRNVYCAICNGVQPKHVIRWKYNYECGLDFPTYFSENFTFTVEDLQKYCTLKPPRKPSFNILSTGQPNKLKRSCYPLKSPSCLDRDTLENITGTEWNQTYHQTVKNKCFGATQTAVTHDLVKSELPFRNRDCAVCNGLPRNELICFLPPTRIDEGDDSISFSIDQARPELPNTFSVLLDINMDGLVIISSADRTTTIKVSCLPTEKYDPVIEACRSVELQDCFQRTSDGATMAQWVNGQCITCRQVILNDTNSFSFHNSTAVNYQNQLFQIEYTNSKGNPIICVNSSDSGSLTGVCNGTLISLNQSDLFSYVDEDSITYGGVVYDVEFNNSRGEPVICVNFSSNGTLMVNTTVDYYGYPVGFFILTYIGCSLSVIGCVLVLLTYSLFKELRTLPGKIIMNLAVAILITNILILLGGPVAGAFPDVVELCVALAILLHYFCLSQFSWMSIMSTEMARTFYKAYKLTVYDTKHSKRSILTMYLVVGWFLPLLITLLTIVVNFSTQDHVLYGVLEDGTRGSCWINHFESAIVALIAPIAISLVFNAVMFVIVSLFLIVAYKSQAKVSKTKNSNALYFRLSIGMFTISGLTWGVGFIAILARSSWAWYPFIIFNSIQGLVIFLVFLFTKKIGKMYLSLLTCKKSKEKSSTISTKRSIVQYSLKDPPTIIDVKQSDHIESTA